MHLSKHLLCLVSMKGLGQWEGGTGVALRRWRRITPSPSLLRIPCWSHFLRTCQLFLPVSFHVLRIWARSIPVGRNWNLVEDMKATFELQMLGCPRETLGENLQPNHRNGMKWLRSASSTCIDRNAWPVLYHIITVYIKMCVTATLHLLYYTWKMDMLLIFNVKLGFFGWVQPQNYDSCVINASRGWCKSSAIPWVCSIPTEWSTPPFGAWLSTRHEQFCGSIHTHCFLKGWEWHSQVSISRTHATIRFSGGISWGLVSRIDGDGIFTSFNVDPWRIDWDASQLHKETRHAK